MAEPLQSKIGFGAKENISAVLEDGRLDAYDVLCLDTQEMGWIDKSGNPVIATSRIQKPIKVNGVDGLGIENGYEIPAGKSLDEIVKMLVQKAIPATYTKPTVSLSAPNSGNYEIGENIFDTLTATFTQNDSQGLVELVIVDSNGNTVASTSDDNSVATETLPIAIKEGAQTYKATASYEKSAVKQNNLGEDSTENAFQAGSVSASKVYTGKWKAFYGSGSGEISAASATIRELESSILGPVTGTSFSISLDVGDQWAMFAYPSSLRSVKEVMYVETNDTNCADNFTHSLITVDGANGVAGREYRVYLYAMATPAEAKMTFKVTI